MTPAEQYQPHIAAAIAGDADRAQWTPTQWRAWFLADSIQGAKPYRLTSTGLLALLGPVRGSAVLTAIAAASPPIAALLAPSEGGLDLAHADSGAFIDGLLAAEAITSEEAAAVKALPVVTGLRHVVLGLPDPRERTMKQALELIGD